MNNTLPTNDKDPKLVALADKIKASPLFVGNTDMDVMMDKQLLFLVAAGLKPAAEVVSGHMERTGNISVSKPDDRGEIEQFLTDLGLAYAFTGHLSDVFMQVIIAKSQAEVEAIMQADNPVSSVMLMGYPDTTVEAFETSDRHDVLSDAETEQLALNTYHDPDFAKFIFIRLSRQHALDELKVFKHWHDELTKYDLIDDTAFKRHDDFYIPEAN